MDLPRIGKKLVDLDLTVTLRTGAPATVASVDVGMAPPGGASDSVVWGPTATVTAGTATFAMVGPDAPDLSTGLVVLTNGDLWARITDAPEIDAARIEHVRLI
jgi:hypothetical protein